MRADGFSFLSLLVHFVFFFMDAILRKKVMREGWLVHCLFLFLSRGRANKGERN